MKNRRRRQVRHQYLRNLIIIWIGLIMTPFLLLLLWDEVENLIENFQPKKEVAKQLIDLTAMQEPLYFEDVSRYHVTKKQEEGEFQRQVYPYSVVDGGVHSVQELRSAIWQDPVVAKHYLNFNLDRARVIEAKADRDFHASYRIGGEIFWTKKRLKVARGERLITDGTNLTRTRCANMLSEVLQGKTSPDEPAPEVLDAPLNPPSDPGPFIPPSPVPNPDTNPGPGPSPSPFSGPVPDPGPDPTPAPVPEPTTLFLLGSGLLGLLKFRKMFRKK